MEINAWIRKKREKFRSLNLLIDQIILPWKRSLAQQASMKDTVCTIQEGNLENEERRFREFFLYIFFDFSNCSFFKLIF